jgi:formamidopyrimidine-DNA glycosylase
VTDLARRGKYLLIGTECGTLILHLGMSGSLRVVPEGTPPGKHDHLDLALTNARALRLRDPRRFGLLAWSPDPPERAAASHPLLRDLGPEPLGPGFGGDYLYGLSRGRRVSVKPFLMDAGVVVGVGNIYASESLFRAGIHPARPAGRVGLERYRRLAQDVRAVLGAAIAQGGTSLRDFVQEDGAPGYFAQELKVYGRAGEPCPGCGAPVRLRRIGQRSSFYCPRCQI